MTLTSNHQFPRHSHDQFGIGVIAFGMQRSWSGSGIVDATAGDVIMVNPGEIHDGMAIGGARMLYLDPKLLAAQTENEGGVLAQMQRPVVSDDDGRAAADILVRAAGSGRSVRRPGRSRIFRIARRCRSDARGVTLRAVVERRRRVAR